MLKKHALAAIVLAMMSPALFAPQAWPAERAVGQADASRTGEAVILVDGASGVPVSTSAPLPVAASAMPLANDASTATNQAAVQANAGSDATKAVAVQGIAGGKPLNTAPDSVMDGVTGTGSATASGAISITGPSPFNGTANIATAGYDYIEFGFTSVGIGASIAVDANADGVGANAVVATYRMDNTASVGMPSTSWSPNAGNTFIAPVSAQSMRIRILALSSGTVTVYATLKRGTPPLPNTPSVVGNIGSGLTDNGNPVKVGCRYNATLPTFADGQRGDCQLSPKGAMLSEEAGRNFTHIASNTTTVAKSAAGFLHNVCINTRGASANTATLYDNNAASGSIIAVLDTTAQSGCFTYDAAFATGLTVLTATGTAADLTLTWR